MTRPEGSHAPAGARLAAPSRGGAAGPWPAMAWRQFRLERRMFEDQARSVLYALLEACPALDIARNDIDGTIHWAGRGEPAFVVFDNVPGGAGHTRRIGQGLPELIAAARDRVVNCECGEETSCYNCLRSYGNQRWHDSLSRGAARDVLDELIRA